MCTGRSRIKLKSTGEVFTLVPPNVKANNLIVGSTWIDNEGEFVLENTSTGARVSMYFTPCGWFGSGRYTVRPILQYSGLSSSSVSFAARVLQGVLRQSRLSFALTK